MKNKIPLLALFVPLALCVLAGAISCSKKLHGNHVPVNAATTVTPLKTDVSMWLTTTDKQTLLQKQNVSLLFSNTSNTNTTINVDTTTQYQAIDGFGFALTGGSATLINRLPSKEQGALLKELFATDSTNIGISYLRISIGASDLSADDFTYDEVSGTDINLHKFNIDAEKVDLIPILKKILAINPAIKILGSPWTAPTWMKTNKSFKGGKLDTAYYDAYARYFVKYIQAMKRQGIVIDAITPQNEPLNPKNNPSMVMEPVDEENFIKNALGPQFKKAGITTKIIVYDHNADRPDYPMTILADVAANQYVDGSGFHLYGGKIDALTPVHDAYPNKNLYFTELYTGSGSTFSHDLSYHVENLLVGAIRNWSRNIIEWNLASDPDFGPHTNGGCTTCQGALTIGNSNISRNVSYYIIAHASKFIRPGAVRIASNMETNLPNVAFKNADGSKVLVVLNSGATAQTFNIKFNSKIVTTTLYAGAVATYKW